MGGIFGCNYSRPVTFPSSAPSRPNQGMPGSSRELPSSRKKKKSVIKIVHLLLPNATPKKASKWPEPSQKKIKEADSRRCTPCLSEAQIRKK